MTIGIVGRDTDPVSAHRARWLGAAAGLGPTVAIGGWWALAGIGVSLADWLVSMGLIAAIAIGAGWITGPLAVDVSRSFAKATIGYALAVIATTTALSIVQAAADTISGGDLSIGGLAVAVVGRAAIGLVSIAYLILPALAFGALWAVVARGILATTERGRAI